MLSTRNVLSTDVVICAGCFEYLFTQPGQFNYWSGEYDSEGHFMTGSVYVGEMKALPAVVELKVDDEYEAEYGPGKELDVIVKDPW